MKVPLRWLAEWIDVPSPDALDERLTIGGLEIEEVVRTGPTLDGIVVGQVVGRRAHPNADRLSHCDVDPGDGELRSIVCGAPNVASGQKVAVALPGTVLADGTKLKKSKIRGVRSEGMICSEAELGLSDQSEGILVLSEDAPVGAALRDVLDVGETVVEFEITPNRGDWASMLGMAREVRAHFGGDLRIPPVDPPEGDRPAASDIRIEIPDADGCHAYVARVVRGIEVGVTPDWAVARLEAAGLRSINNVVDATNLVLLEFGQPLHAFDLETLRGREISVRAAREGEKIRTLDDQMRELLPEDLVIADAERAVAIAGVMGGADTEVRESTCDILIESAHFDPRRIRRTSKRLGLRSDASYRFERGVDAQGLARAADRCARMIAEWTGGEVSLGRVEARGTPFAHCDRVELDPGHPDRLLGTTLSRDEIAALLARVDIRCEDGPGGVLVCSVPSWRNDISIPQDLVEEVGRIHGLDHIAPTLPVARLEPARRPHMRVVLDRARDTLAACGLLEARSIPMLSPGDLDALRLDADHPLREAVELLNPIIEQDSIMRTTLVPGLLRALARNRARRIERVRLFEVGCAFLSRGESELPNEPQQAVALIAGSGRAALWEGTARPTFFEAKGIAERVIEDLGFAPRFAAGSDAPWLHPGASGRFRVGKREVGRVGDLHPEVAASFGLDVPVTLLEVEVGVLAQMGAREPHYTEVSPYPSSERDLAVLLSSEQPAGEVLSAIRQSGGALLAGVELFDRYTGKGIPDDKVSLAFRLVFQGADRTLTDGDVAKATERIVGVLEGRFGGQLR